MRSPLFDHIERIIRDRGASEDALQETLYTIARKLPSLREPQWFRAWAYRIATREAIRRSRAERFWARAERDDAIERLATHEDETLDPETETSVMKALDDLPPATRIVLRMHYTQELSYREIAEALEIPVGTVKSRAAYGLAQLRAKPR